MFHARKNGRRAILQNLEQRQLFSTLNVLDYGAGVNDGQSDHAAIRAAINDSDSGDTIYFPKGEYEIGSEIKLRGDRNYVGEGGAARLTGNPKRHIFKIHQDNILIEGFTFHGKPIFLDKPGNKMVEGIIINGNTFDIHARGESFNGITFTTGLRNSEITNNTFGPIGGDNGIYGYNWDNLKIAYNEFLDGNEGIHVIDHSNKAKNLTIEQNYFSGLRRMGIEYQGGGRDTIVQDNYYENPALSDKAAHNGSTFAYSIIADTSVNTIIRRNTSIAPQRPDGKGVRIVFEVGGDNCLVEQNYSVDGNHVLAANDGHGSTSILVRNNLWYGHLQEPSGRGLKLDNNGKHVELNWDINRGKPGPGKRLSLTGFSKVDSANSSNPPGDKKPIPWRPPTPDANGFINVSDLRWTSANNGWGPVELDQSTGGKDANDGGKLTIGGKTYKKGLGAAIGSEIVYDLNGGYSTFVSDIGIDDSAGNEGSVTFQVWADGKKIYDSGLIRGQDRHKSFELDVTGVDQLKLVTTNGNDGNRNDRANWAAPRLKVV